MLVFKCGLIILFSTYIYSLCMKITQETNYFDNGLAILYLASATLAGKIMYDRYQHINILGSLTQNPNVTSYANRVASFSASLLSVGFLAYIPLCLYKVDNHFLTAFNIFICGMGTLYIWMQCILTAYISTLFYDKRLSVFRQCLANVSFLLLAVMAGFGLITTISPAEAVGAKFSAVMTTFCSYALTAIYCVFILSFEKEYIYFSEGLRSDMLLDDDCSLDNGTLSDVDSLFGTQELLSSPSIIKDSIFCAKVS